MSSLIYALICFFILVLIVVVSCKLFICQKPYEVKSFACENPHRDCMQNTDVPSFTISGQVTSPWNSDLTNLPDYDLPPAYDEVMAQAIHEKRIGLIGNESESQN